MILTRNVLFPAFTGTEERRLYIYLPTDYHKKPERRYPVLYMFDGHNVFFDHDATYGKSWGMGDYLDYTDTPLIVVALECHHGSHNERLFEYSPYDYYEEGYGHIKGKADITMRYLTRVLKPAIDKKLRTLPDREHTYISGSSMGGLISLYAVLKYNQYFSKCAALSPSIFLCYEDMKNLVRKSKVGKNTTVYMDLGTEEMSLEGGSEAGFSSFGKMMIDKKIAVTQRVIPGGQHCEASWEKQIPIFVPTLLYEPEI